MATPIPLQDASARPGALPPTKRGLELLMIAFATIVVTTALVLVELNQPQGLTSAVLYDGAAYLALFSAAHPLFIAICQTFLATFARMFRHTAR